MCYCTVARTGRPRDAGSASASASRNGTMTRTMETLLDLLDDAVARFGDRPALGIRHEDGTTATWTYRELERSSRAAAFRLRALGLQPGDRLLTWSPSTPELPATYLGAMRAGIVLVPLDLRMSKEAIEGIVASSGAAHLVLGTGRDAPDPVEFGLGAFPTSTVEAIGGPPGSEAGAPLPLDWEAQVAAYAPARPRRSGRADLHLGDDRHAEGRDARPRQPARVEPDVPPDRAADGPPDRVAAAAVAPARAGRRACTTRSRSGRASCTCGAGTRG